MREETDFPMETKKQLRSFTDELLKTRQLLQDGRPLTDSEQHILKASLEALLLDLKANAQKAQSS
jgi:hypothetical protein